MVIRLAFVVCMLAATLVRVSAAQDVEVTGLPETYQEATIESYTDGDKIRVLVNGENQEVNLIGSDAPEPAECYAWEASKYLQTLLPPTTTVYLESDNKDKDGSDRLLRYIWVAAADGKAYIVNTKLVRDGYAEWKSKDDNEKYDSNFKRADKTAREDKRGIWEFCRDEDGDKIPLPCLDVPQATIDAVSFGVESGLTLSGWKAIAAYPTASLPYFVAAKITGEGFGDGEKAVWAVDNLDAPGNVLSSEAMAAEFSEWPDAGDTPLGFNQTTPGVDEAEDCVE